MNLCLCGCGKEVTCEKNKYLHGHHIRGVKWNSDVALKRKQTMINRYDVENSMQLKEFREKCKQTCFKNSGYEYPMQSIDTQEKYKHTCLKKYDVENTSQLKEVKCKIKQTNIEKYGGASPFSSTGVQEKSKQTMLKNRGVEWAMQSEEVQEKSKQTSLLLYGGVGLASEKIQEKFKKTCKEKMGVENPFQSEEIKEKIKQTCLEKYGVDHFSKTPQGRKCSRITHIRCVETQKLNGEPVMPCIGSVERVCLNIFEQLTPFKIIRNDHSIFDLVGFFPDGHILELKLFIEFDEKFHYVDDDCKTLRQEDIDRQLILESIPGYRVFRVSKKDWDENQDQVILNFKMFFGGDLCNNY